MDKTQKNLPWVSKSEYIDEETGEVIEKKQAIKHYIKLKKDERKYKDGNVNIRHITWICGKNKQLTIW